MNRHTSSDHYLLVARVQHPKQPSTGIMTITSKLRDLDATALADVIAHQITSSSRATPTAEELAEDYKKILSTPLDKLAPAHTRTVTRRRSQQWYTDDFLALKQRKRQAEDVWQKTGLHVDQEIFKSIQSSLLHQVESY